MKKVKPVKAVKKSKFDSENAHLALCLADHHTKPVEEIIATAKEYYAFLNGTHSVFSEGK